MSVLFTCLLGSKKSKFLGLSFQLAGGSVFIAVSER